MLCDGDDGIGRMCGILIVTIVTIITRLENSLSNSH